MCDACWTAAGAAEVEDQAPALQPAGVAVGDLHPLDALVVTAGLRWSVLRWVVPVARRQLAAEVAEREATPPPDTRPADSGQLWLDAVCAAVGAAAFRGDRARNVMAVAHGLVKLVEHEGRPLTWVTQAELAAAAGVTDRTVRTHVRWLRSVGLLHELIGGRRAPMMSRPVDETAAEAETRREAEQAAQAAEDARISHARTVLATNRERAAAELSAVREGASGDQAAQLALQAVPALDVQIPEDWGGATRPLVNIAPVYELRVPLTPAEAAERRSVVRSTHNENFRPPSGSLFEKVSPEAYGVWISRGASRRSESKGAQQPQFGSELPGAGSTRPVRGVGSAKPSSRAQASAQRLVGSLLRPEVAEGVSVRWLTGQLRRCGLLAAGWTDQDLADQIHGWHEFPQLPRRIRNTRGWVTARLQRATPALPPSRLAQIAEAESIEGAARQAARHAAVARVRRDENAQRRAEVDGCSLCDELGWLEVADPAVGAVRCSHDSDTGGW